VRLISSAEETAREVAETLGVRGQLAPDADARTEFFATTGDAEEFRSLGARILQRPIARVSRVRLAELEALEASVTPGPTGSTP
jgi:glutamate racemase